jgi:hypothetical protein
MFSIFGLLAGIVSFFSKAWGFFTTRSQQKAGADAQTTRDIQAAEPVEAAQAQAIMDAPKTKPAALSRLRGGDA